ALRVYLISPHGTKIALFENICVGQPDVDITLDETIVWIPAPSVVNALCNPLGQEGIYRPMDSFKAFCGEEAGGDWTLEIYTDGNVSGVLANWELQILYQLPYDQPDVVLENAPGLCTQD
ncbi:proprotein convertase P-domain-containing protein, partial [Arthrospira platensis SPKY1]|nr:proprotein convertase P-domain-containing protein [Arthrospira platensis SPKY1]